MKSLIVVALIAAVLGGNVVRAQIPGDLVEGLEGITGYTKPWYSGYLDVFGGNKIHYLFFPSQNNPVTDPVLLWLNGGPGCSSMLGAVQENGPFVFIANSTQFELNPYSWNNNASVLYFESPPGVGFSIAKQKKWNDTLTAQANLDALVQFFNNWESLRSNDFFIAGESYAGIYVPYLATYVDQYNSQQESQSTRINFKGFAVGNGCTDPLECNFQYDNDPFQAELLYDQGFYPPELRLQYLHDCARPELFNKIPCIKSYNEVMYFLGQGENTANIYDLIGLCYWQELPGEEGETAEERAERSRRALHHHQAQWLGEKRDKVAGDSIESDLIGLSANARPRGEPVPGLPPCTDGVGPYTFFNNPQVKQALHVDTSITWYMCGGNIGGWDYDRSKTGSYPLYPHLIEQKYRIWIYSGDTDAAVPTLGTLFWLNQIKQQMGLETVTNWRAWYQPPLPTDPSPNNRQNAGQFWQIEGITVVLFKGVGHMVPQYNRIGASEMINTFFKGGILPAQ